MNTDRFVFFGTGGLLSSITLTKLIESNRVPVYTIVQGQEDSVYPNLTLQIAEQNKLDHTVVSKLTEEVIAEILSRSPAFGVMASFGSIIKKPLLGSFRIINVHMGVLPDYRGPVTNFWKILKGDDLFGATIHEISEEIDGGKILKIVEKDFSEISGAPDFFRMNYEMAADALIDVLENEDDTSNTPIDTSKGNYYPHINEQDLILDPKMPAKKLHKIINRLQFYGNPKLMGLELTSSTLLIDSNDPKQENQLITVNSTRSIFKNATGILLLTHLPIDC